MATNGKLQVEGLEQEIVGAKGGDEVNVVYGKHNIQDRKSIWKDLKGTMNGVNWPSVLMGDFNSIMSIEDRIQGNLVQDVEVRDFKNIVGEVGLIEIRTIGRYYTWTNNTVHSRIDRILVNVEWIQKWPQMEGIIMQHEFSDHCPLMITMAEDIVQGELKKLNTQEYMSVGGKIKETKNKLIQLQQDMQSPENDSAVKDEETKTKMELAK
ncbi:uncharacterized protein [Nicotiana sylvestris]|uniref:uncharacterized protein n=1 Tax=Nicotiana sylvestris TaxID=4096 RepID=UPI00388C5DDD